MTEIIAKSKNVRSSAQKTRLLADLIRNMPIANAIDALSFSDKKAAVFVLKTLNSAIANAENNFDLDVDDLRIKSVCVDEGRTMKRMKPRAKGRSNRILKRMCHVMVVLTDNQAK
ncbi:50S ribosomal protein L22 [Gammaproteobacteria bacterium]|nr:50S ribosomal protein L22 [Gammaproteobacteria bacterium]